MSSSLYSPLNGEEIRTIIKNRIIKEVDNLPYLKRGNSFHRAKVQFAFVMQAYPADVPIPDEREIEFNIDAPSLQGLEEAINKVEKAEDSIEKVNELQLLVEKANELLNNAREALPYLVREHEIQAEIDGAVPDKARIEGNLPVTVEKMERGRRIETQVPALEFKKMVK